MCDLMSFFMHGISLMVNRAGLPQGCAGPLVRFLVDPYGSPPVIDQETDGDCKPQSLEDFTMSQDKSARASRAPVTQTRISANGTTDSITWIREATAIKRLRRHLAKSGCTLHISREGSADRQRHGEYFIRDDGGHLIDDKINLSAWMRSYGLLAPLEMIDPPLGRGWLFYIGRYERVVVDGIECNHAKPITRTYTTEAAARRAVEHLTDRTGLVLCAFDAGAKGGTHE